MKYYVDGGSRTSLTSSAWKERLTKELEKCISRRGDANRGEVEGEILCRWALVYLLNLVSGGKGADGGTI